MENSNTTSKFAAERKKLFEAALENTKTALSLSKLPTSDLKSSDKDLINANMVQSDNSQTGTANTHILGIHWTKSKLLFV